MRNDVAAKKMREGMIASVVQQSDGLGSPIDSEVEVMSSFLFSDGVYSD